MSSNNLWKNLSVKRHLGSDAAVIQVTTTRTSLVGIHVAPHDTNDTQIAMFDWDGTGSTPTGLASDKLAFCFNSGDSGANMPKGGFWVPMPSDTAILFEDGIYVKLEGAAGDYDLATAVTVFYMA
jgi:hypothetical protein